MFREMFEEEVNELEKMGVFTTKVKCGEFYSIAQVIRFYKLVKPQLDKAGKDEIEERQE